MIEIKNVIYKSLIDSLNLDEIKSEPNKLECVCINFISKEKNQYEIFLNQLKNKTNKNLSKDLSFIIITNNFVPEENIDLKEMFKEVKIYNLNLTEHEDLYIPFKIEKRYIEENKDNIPAYGIKSGPNLMFFKSMELSKEYDTTLLLETDCILSNDWLEKIKNYVENSNEFWISGALYDGEQFSTDPTMLTHINGVALYATGKKNFQIFMQHFEQDFLESVKQTPNLAYDWAFRCFINENIKNKKDHFFWKFINRNYVANKFIFNFSLSFDENFDENKIMNLYNYAILHKKQRLPVDNKEKIY
jgi:hypothetical protein